MAKKTIRYYACSELFNSSELPDQIKNLLKREPATYRITKQEGSLTPKEKRDSREVVRKQRKVPVMSQEGVKEIELSLVEFDKPLWRFYFECSTLRELNEFFEELDEIGFSFNIQSVDNDGEGFNRFLEHKFGLEPIQNYIIYFEDSWLLDEMDEDEDEEGEEE